MIQVMRNTEIEFEVECVTRVIQYPAETALIKGLVRLTGQREKANLDERLSIGLRVVDEELTRTMFETGINFPDRIISPEQWYDIQTSVPYLGDAVGQSVFVIFDILVSGLRDEQPGNRIAAFPIDYVSFRDLSAESRHDTKGDSAVMDSQHQIREPSAVDLDSRQSRRSVPSLIFDVSDLLHYFFNARLPTGIQRVQIEVITSLIFKQKDVPIQIVSFSRDSDRWLLIPELFFNHICKIALVGGERDAQDWVRVLSELKDHLSAASIAIFAEGSYLINLGTSWWLKNYFLHVRFAKARFGIRYIPYVHDCIPIITPEHCVEQLTRDFISWGLGAFEHADHIFVNSKSTAIDVVRVASHLGHRIPDPSVVTLDADYRLAVSKLNVNAHQSIVSNLFSSRELETGRYVLFVSTIESRKNHVMALSAWLSLIKRYGKQKVPKLVCVGNRGWLNDAVYDLIQASKQLEEHVLMLSKIPDQDLRRLYENCSFTIYPSKYEGWGLPVTESLCFGKIPVVNRSSSLPEAAGEFGEYFDLESEKDFVSVLTRLIVDQEFRMSREAAIKRNFRARPWDTIADEIVNQIKVWSSEESSRVDPEMRARGVWPVDAELGVFHSFAENQETQIWSNMRSGEVYRQGEGWWWPEPWGCWTKPEGARLAFRVTRRDLGRLIIYLCLRGLDEKVSTAKVRLEGGVGRKVTLPRGEDKWVVLKVDDQKPMPSDVQALLVSITVTCDESVDFRKSTNGVDPRVVSAGVRGFMVCPLDDLSSRLQLVETIGLGDFSALTERPDDAIDLLS